MKNEMITVTYGKSMYGGYYANFFNGEYTGEHARTIKELKQKLNTVLGSGNYSMEKGDNY